MRLLTSFCLSCDSPLVAILQGEHGSGKTALLARALAVLQQPQPVLGRSSSEGGTRVGGEEVGGVVARFVGATPASCNAALLGHSICEELCEGYASAGEPGTLLPEQVLCCCVAVCCALCATLGATRCCSCAILPALLLSRLLFGMPCSCGLCQMRGELEASLSAAAALVQPKLLVLAIDSLDQVRCAVCCVACCTVSCVALRCVVLHAAG